MSLAAVSCYIWRETNHLLELKALSAFCYMETKLLNVMLNTIPQLGATQNESPIKSSYNNPAVMVTKPSLP